MVKKKKASKKKSSVPIEDLNFVLNNLLLPIVIADNKGRIKRFNDSWKEMFCLKEELPKSYANKSYFDILNSLEQRAVYTKDVKDKIEEILKKALAGNIKAKFLEFPIGDKWFLSHMHPVHKKGKINGFIITHHDVSVWKQKEQILQAEKIKTYESSQRKTFFLANLNHELKTPLNSIMGFSQLLKEEISANAQLEQYCGFIENISEAANHLNSIVFRILNMAKTEYGTLTLQEERVTPARLIQLSFKMVEPMFPNRGIKFEVSKDAAIETLKCDKNLAMEVLINLLVNALKFSDKMVHINCTISEEKDLIMSVTDQGMGMTEDEIKIALEPFGQNIRTPNDKHAGLGLGVPFCNQIMNLHGGYLKIESQKGIGTTVSAVFPSHRIAI